LKHRHPPNGLSQRLSRSIRRASRTLPSGRAARGDARGRVIYVQGRSAHGRISRDFCQNRPDDVSRASAFAEGTHQDRGTPGAYFCPVHRQAPNRVQATALVCWSFAPADQPGADDKSRPVGSRDGPGRIAIALPDLLGNIGASRRLDVPQSSLKPRHARGFLYYDFRGRNSAAERAGHA
jgi:hypothetical protein